MAGYNRPEDGWRFHFQGIKVNSKADSLEATKYPMAQNIRAYSDQSVRTRPGYTKIFGVGLAVTDLRSYSAIETDNLPRFLARDISNNIYLDTGTKLGTLNGSSQGVFMIPFRPNQSPQAWMYIGTQGDYKKVSAPDSNNNAVFVNVGIPEQPNPPATCPQSLSFYDFSGLAANWAQSGSATAPADGNRIGSDIINALFADPASGPDIRYSLHPTIAGTYQIGQELIIDKTGRNIRTIVQDVIPPINNGIAITIASIYYYSGTTGRCIVVPTQMATNASVPTFSDNTPSAGSVYTDAVISSLRRGAIVDMAHGLSFSEECIILSVTTGPLGQVCFEISTVQTYVPGDSITGLTTVVVTGINGTVPGKSLDSADITFSCPGASTGAISQNLGTNPFIQLMNPVGVTPQENDYIVIGILLDNPNNLLQGTIIFNTDPTVNYTNNGFYFQFTAGDLLLPSDTTQTPVVYPLNQWGTLFIPISSLQRLGGNQSLTLAQCNGVRVSLLTSATVNAAISSLAIIGGGQVDASVGATGLPPYFYAVTTYDPTTGAESNPSPITRYGVSPIRQSVILSMTDVIKDPQMKLWNIYRFGGSIQSWRRLGQVVNSLGGLDTFIDNYSDFEANGGPALEFDNFEPWPTIDLPFNLTSGVVAGITSSIKVTGTSCLLVWSSGAAFSDQSPATITRWLPGTEVLLNGQFAFTLWTRPVPVILASPPAANYFAYLLQFVEDAGSPIVTTISIIEPNVANQHLPYLWGPDTDGTIFGAGDPFRPGTVYSCKSFAPDAAPDSYNQEITAPTEPILGGEILNGLSYTASSNNWWALYPNFGSGDNRYQAVKRPVGRGLAAPYAHCSDGKSIYFVAKDGIWMHSGGTGVSLTDADLYTLFPHEGINAPQNYTYANIVLYAPDYKYAADFRLTYGSSFLYFDYRDSEGFARTLTCDLKDPTHPSWVPDVFSNNPVLCHAVVEQPEGTLQSTTQRYALTLLADDAGNVHQMQDQNNDNGLAIIGNICTFEYNCGDLRATDLFNDIFIDALPSSGIEVQPINNGLAVAVLTAIPVSTSRIQTNIPIALEFKYLGVSLSWIDDFTAISSPTQVNAWQPMYQPVPVSVFQWVTQGTSFGWKAYGHLRQWNFAYRSTAPVIITVTVQDGTSPQPITLPSTGGQLQKILFPFTFNKGMLYFFKGVSTQQWTPYLSESELYAGEWDRQSPYALVHDIDGPIGIRS